MRFDRKTLRGCTACSGGQTGKGVHFERQEYADKWEFTVTVRADFPVHGRSALPEIQPRL